MKDYLLQHPQLQYAIAQLIGTVVGAVMVLAWLKFRERNWK